MRNKAILLGVTGGVAAYKAVDLIRRLREEGASVTVVMTEAAKKFITPLSLEIASQNKVYTDLFSDPLSHVTLPAHADVLVVAPATANTIAKFARGIADNYRPGRHTHISGNRPGVKYNLLFCHLSIRHSWK